ncbi:MAG: protein NirG [Geminicoccaceae bacterium]|jgi:DNA-binding Lrp family transcriptional regulator|nr:MAG: protein NirG [Geminicoccaceae bacterium]
MRRGHLDPVDRVIVVALQRGVPIVERPFAELAASLETTEEAVVARLARLVSTGLVSRFAPMLDAEKLGGAVSLCAMAVPPDRFDEVATILAAMPEVAHNYEREHRFNMWFVLAVERPEDLPKAIARIEAVTGLSVLDLPKLEEYRLELVLPV